MHRCHSNSWPLATLFVICGTLSASCVPSDKQARTSHIRSLRDEWRRDVTPIHKLRRSLYIHSVRALLTHLPTFLFTLLLLLLYLVLCVLLLLQSLIGRRFAYCSNETTSTELTNLPTHTYSKNARHRPRRSSRPTQGTHTSHPPALHPHN